jgi:hypothetical protein
MNTRDLVSVCTLVTLLVPVMVFAGGKGGGGGSSFPPGDTPPNGSLDSVLCADSTVNGWAQDVDAPANPISVYFWIDSSPSSDHSTAGSAGNVSAGDTRTAPCGTSSGACTHAYKWKIPDAYLDGKPHSVRAYGIDTTVFAGAILVGSPRSFACTPPVPTATLSLTPASITNGQNATLTWDSTNATSCTIDGLGKVAVSGTMTITRSQSSVFTGSCTGPGGTTPFNNGNTSGLILTVCPLPQSCTPSYSCVGPGNQTIARKEADCSVVSTGVTCAAPEFCTEGQPTCHSLAPKFNASGLLSGHLQAKPSIVKRGDTTTLYWDVSNVLGCTVSGNGDLWQQMASGIAGVVTKPIMAQAMYTLACSLLPSSTASPVSETQTINILPTFQEQ